MLAMSSPIWVISQLKLDCPYRIWCRSAVHPGGEIRRPRHTIASATLRNPSVTMNRSVGSDWCFRSTQLLICSGLSLGECFAAQDQGAGRTMLAARQLCLPLSLARSRMDAIRIRKKSRSGTCRRSYALGFRRQPHPLGFSSICPRACAALRR
jgi:hypothetical protein